VVERFESFMDAEIADARRSLESSRLDEVAMTLLDYWWNVREPLAAGWLHIVSDGLLATDNIKDISRDPEFRAELEQWEQRVSTNRLAPWRELMTATGLAHSVNRDHVLSFPSSREAKELAALVSRFYSALPYGGTVSRSLAAGKATHVIL
jgi:hypothetical protein